MYVCMSTRTNEYHKSPLMCVCVRVCSNPIKRLRFSVKQLASLSPASCVHEIQCSISRVCLVAHIARMCVFREVLYALAMYIVCLPPASQESLRLMTRHTALARPLMPLVPKHHQWWHMSERQGNLGGWKAYATWADEGLNRLLRDSARGAHQACFEVSLLWRMRKLLAA